jgi:hypothetical protein
MFLEVCKFRQNSLDFQDKNNIERLDLEGVRQDVFQEGKIAINEPYIPTQSL